MDKKQVYTTSSVSYPNQPYYARQEMNQMDVSPPAYPDIAQSDSTYCAPVNVHQGEVVAIKIVDKNFCQCYK